jgi:hypothetical protein
MIVLVLVCRVMLCSYRYVSRWSTSVYFHKRSIIPRDILSTYLSYDQYIGLELSSVPQDTVAAVTCRVGGIYNYWSKLYCANSSQIVYAVGLTLYSKAILSRSPSALDISQ